MKKYAVLLLVLSAITAVAQDEKIKPEQLAVPSSPAFILTDITPTLVQNPNTPKAFAFGIAQSYQESGTGFPNNYSAEFVPYWWMRSGGRDVYNFLGLKTIRDGQIVTRTTGENPFAGLRFTSFSVAFINKDLIPDTFKSTQKIFSVGVGATIFKIHFKGYAEQVHRKIAEWHTSAQHEFDIPENQAIQDEIARHPENQDAILEKWHSTLTDKLREEINTLINQKPILSWDVAAATSTYGINDRYDWITGRSGIWTTIASYIPLALGSSPHSNKSYFNLNFTMRYLTDEFQKNDLGGLGYSDNLDVGGKVGLEFDQFSIGVEALYRYAKGVVDVQNRTVGVISYKVTDNIYLNGTFGKNFDIPDKLIATFGINWGIGKEQVTLPSAQNN